MSYGKARKKPVSIHFFKQDGDTEGLRSWLFSHSAIPHEWIEVETSEDNKVKLRVKTLEGSSYDVPEGYIIIRGVEGEYYPCEPEIFNKTYDVLTLHTEDEN